MPALQAGRALAQYAPRHLLNCRPEPQGQGSLRPTGSVTFTAPEVEPQLEEL
jgi:hypothetical protein